MKNEASDTDTAAHWAGVDVAKRTFDAALVRDGQKWPATALRAIPVRSFGRTPEGVAEFVRWLDGAGVGNDPAGRVRAVMEATGRYSIELAAWMRTARPALAPAIAPPHQTAAFIRSLGVREKTDQIEARALGFYGMERAPAAYKPPPATEAALRDLCRYRDSLVRERVAAANQAEEGSNNPMVRTMQRKRIRLNTADIERVEARMQDEVAALPHIQRDADLLATLPGVGFLTALCIRTELGDLRRFEKARRLTAFAGLNPSRRESGTSVRSRTRMSKQGNKRVRRILYLAALAAIRGVNEMSIIYNTLIDNHKSSKAALGAVMRKLLVLMRAILIRGIPYDPQWRTRCKSA